MKSRQHVTGFTLVELLVGITIFAILLGVALPSFRTYITKNTVENMQDRLASAVTFARSEAATRNAVVTLCSSNTGTSCVDNQWRAGWIVFVDNNANQKADPEDGAVPAEEILQSHQMATNTNPISFMQEAVGAGSATSISALSFTSQGFVRGEIRTFATFCSNTNQSELNRGLTIERSGRVVKGNTIAFDGKSATTISCP